MILFSVLIYLSILLADAQKCEPKVYEGAFLNQVCVCNATFCDTIEPVVKQIPTGQFLVYKSSLSGDRLKKLTVNADKNKDFETNATIFIDASRRFQKIFGFGGAFTDAAGINLAAVPENLQDQILKAYFGASGLEYNIGRVPMASCDFSTHEYSYAEDKYDYDLKSFRLAKEDLEMKIPFILRATRLATSPLQLFASPWSAPGWMKVTGKMRGGGSLINSTKIYQAYAKYFVRFFEAYKSHNVDFWGVTIQNEPSTGADLDWGWQTTNFTGETMRDFLRNYLGPALKGNSLTKNLKVMILDDDRGLLPGWADATFNDSVTRDFADGIGLHWYGNMYSPAIFLDITHNRHPDKFILATEACTGSIGHHGPIMGDWFRAESYAQDIISDLNHWVTGWTDWNLVLDEKGGPTWVGNVVDAPIIVNHTAQEFYKQPMFYAMGHFSKFLPRNSTRIGVKVNGNRLIHATAVTQTGGRRVTVILNQSNDEVPIRISDVTSSQNVSMIISPRSIYTVLWDKK